MEIVGVKVKLFNIFIIGCRSYDLVCLWSVRKCYIIFCFDSCKGYEWKILNLFNVILI